MILLLATSILIVALISLILYARWNYGSLETLNIPVIKPHCLLGSTHDAHLVVNGLRDIEWMKKYGPIYGVYEGREAQVHVNDIEMIRHIMVKDYDHFSERRLFDVGDPIMNEMPGLLKGEKWKFVRQLFSPQLTGAKAKLMSPSMNDALKDYIADLKSQMFASETGTLENYNLKNGMFEMTTDLILRCIFNIQVNVASPVGQHFVAILKKLLFADVTVKPNLFLLPWTLSFPFIKKIFSHPSTHGIEASKQFASTFKKLMDDRRQSGCQRGDFTDYIMELLEKIDTLEFKQAGVTELTLMCQAFLFFFAGQDQITHLILLLVHYACQNPEVEQKIMQELDKVLANHNGVIDHECLSEITYLTACINEVLRLYPVVFRAERVCMKDWEMVGIKIRKGMTVMIPLWAANRNPKYFDNPDEFNPERFMPYNKDKLHPYALNSFGHGPKNCTGIRFSYEVLQLTAARLFNELEFTPQDSGAKISFEPGNLFFHSANPLFFRVRPRVRIST